MGRMTTTPGGWIVRGIGLWLLSGIVGLVLALVVDGTSAENVAQSPLAQIVGLLGFIALGLCLVAAFVSWNWDLRPEPPKEPPRAATDDERYGSLYAAADDLDRRKGSRRR